MVKIQGVGGEKKAVIRHLHLQDLCQFLCFSLFPCIAAILIPSFLASLWQFKHPVHLSESSTKLKRPISVCSPQWGEQRTNQKTLYISRLRKICHLKINSQFQIHLPCWWQNLPTRIGKQLGGYSLLGSWRHDRWCWWCYKVYSAWGCVRASSTNLL